MKILRTNRMPDRLTGFIELSTLIKMSLDLRFSLMGKLNGYPVPTSVVARMMALLDLNSIEGLLNSLLRLRNVAKFAADILTALPQLKVGRIQLNLSTVKEFINANADIYISRG